MWLLHWLPSWLTTFLGKIIGLLLYVCFSSSRKVAMINLTLCFPKLSQKSKQQLILRHFQYIGSFILEYGRLWFSSKNRLKKWIRVEGYEHFLAAQKDHAVILFAPHFIGLDIGGFRHGIDHPINGAVVYSRQKNPLLERLIMKGRSRFGDPIFLAKQDGIRPIIRALRQKMVLYYLPDQDFGHKNSRFIPFFDVPTATTDALSRLASATNAKIVPMVTKRDSNGYVVRYYPAWENFPSEDIDQDTRRMNAFIEERVLEMPEQYLWLYKRFKTRPTGEKSIYP